jgi:hypothetical protein
VRSVLGRHSSGGCRLSHADLYGSTGCLDAFDNLAEAMHLYAVYRTFACFLCCIHMIYEYDARKSMGFMPYAAYMLDVLSLRSLSMQHFDHQMAI